MIQVAPRSWSPEAVRDSVRAVAESREFRRSLQSTLGERLLLWMGEGITKLVSLLHGMPGGRSIALWIAALLVLAVAARLLIAARARDPDAPSRMGRSDRARREDPWRAAERLAAEGDPDGAAHAMYRGALASIAASDGIRLDPSKTSGDYARELRRRGSAAYQPFRAFSRRFDVAVYGDGRCDAALLDDLRRLAVPLRERSGARAA
ncbi:MAG: hypothetical protein JWN53_530 [Gemmatimonadetes bacterium]|jgi:hypothetical protein|nr:hypothetical protein [Gemmatimonadota bacterium]